MKNEVRKKLLLIRDNLNKEDVISKSIKISNNLFNTKEYNDSKIILCYASIKNEVDTLGIIKKALNGKKIVALPKVISDNMLVFCEIKSLSDLKLGYMNIMEPITKEIDSSLLNDALLIVPGTGFDKSLYRMGYGKGYYDRFIKNNKVKYKIGLAFDIQVLENIPHDEYDQKMDMIITEDKMYRM